MRLFVLLTPVDALEHLSGLDADRIVEAHGSFVKARCVDCKTQVDDAWLKEKVKKGMVALCEQPKCASNDKRPPIKPDITCV